MSSPNRERIQHAANILADLRRRRLTVKAFQLQQRYPSDPLDQQPAQKRGLIEFREEIEHIQKLPVLRSALLDEVEAAMRADASCPSVSRVELEASVAVHAVGKTKGGQQIARAYLLPSAGRPIPFREYTVNRTAWADGYMTDQPVGFVFAAEHLADVVYVAVEKLLRTRYEVLLPTSAMEASKRDAEAILGLKSRLAKAGYYAGVPFDIRPVPKQLAIAHVGQVISRFLPTLAAYQAPVAPSRLNPSVAVLAAGISGSGGHDVQASGEVAQVRPRRTRLSRESIQEGAGEQQARNWLRQFDDDNHIACAVSLLERFRMLKRPDTVDALTSFMDANPQFEQAVVVPFGSARDSGAVQTYFSGDLIGSRVSRCANLSEIAGIDSRTPIIFIDDFIGSGGQGQDILAAGFGVDALRKDLGEQRDIFDDGVQSRLRAGKVGFVFTAAWDSGLQAMREACAGIELHAEVYGHIPESELPFAFDGPDAGSGAMVSFRARCEEIGRQLAAGGMRGEAKDREAKAASRCLGYGNRAMLLASPFNVPTQTLIQFWADGLVDGVEWVSLMPRRKKQ